MDMSGMFSLFELGLGAYLLYCSFTNKGQLFRNDNIKKGMEKEYHRLIRLFGFILGPMMIALGAVDYLSGGGTQNPTLRILMYVLWGLTMAGIVLLFVLTLRMTDRDKAKSSSNARKTGSQGAPRAAFEFDEEDTKKGDTKPEEKKK